MKSGDITEEELKAAFSRAEMQLNDASSALLALLTQVPVRLPDTYTIHDNINAITDISEKNAAAFESLREAAAMKANDVRETSRRGRVCAGNNRKPNSRRGFEVCRRAKSAE